MFHLAGETVVPNSIIPQSIIHSQQLAAATKLSFSVEQNQNAAKYFVDRHGAGEVASKPAFIETDGANRTLSYGELAAQCAKMAALYEKHGIRREERAAVLVLDTIEFPIIFWGSVKCGVIPVALNTLLGTDVYDTILRDCRARVLFVSEQLLPTVKNALANNPHLDKVFVVGSKCDDYLHFDQELKLCESRPTIEAVADECAFWLYSSGSTGKPKGIRHAHESLRATADAYGDKVLGIRQSDVVFSAAKMFFAYGLGNAMTFPMSVGATAVLLSGRPTPEAVTDILNKYQPTVFCGVPTLYAAMNSLIGSGKRELETKLRRCISAGEALPEDVGTTWERLSGCEILDGVGSTEMLHIFLSNRSGEVVYGTSGQAVDGYELRLVNDRGNKTKVDELGELLVNGRSSALDYWNQRDKSRCAFEGKWTRTGDKYTRREDGRFVYCGRTDDMFKVSGMWVSPFEIEQSLASHASVLEAAVVAAKDDDGLEKPKAFVVLNEDADSQTISSELKRHVQSRIGRWKYPRWIEVVDDLPKTATGKIQRFKLRQ